MIRYTRTVSASLTILVLNLQDKVSLMFNPNFKMDNDV